MTPHDHIYIIDGTRNGDGLANPADVLAALHDQDLDASAAWERFTTPVSWVPKGATVPAGSLHHWRIYILDNPDVAGALGYHDVDQDGHVYGRVFRDACLKDGVTVSSCLSHEYLEAKLDPWCNGYADLDGHRATATEACDAVEDRTYRINGVEVSDWLLPSWFTSAGTPPYSYLHSIDGPGKRTAGGYTIDLVEGQVAQHFGDNVGVRTEHGYRRARPGHVAGAPQPSRAEWRLIRELAR